MKNIELTENELFKYELIKRLVEQSGNKNKVAVTLKCSLRHVNRLIKGYKENGKDFFSHGNKYRKPAIALSEDTINNIFKLYSEKYFDFNFRHFHQKLLLNEKINCSYPTVRALLISKGIVSSKMHKKTKKKMKLALEQCEKEEVVAIELAPDYIVNPKLAHPRMPRCKYFGELIQMDASNHIWFGNAKSYLHIAIDDATGRIVGAFFDNQETLKGYYEITSQIFLNYGIPAKFLTDKRTVFDYKNSGSTLLENDYSTQFGMMCSKLGIEIETSSVPQAKGRVERVFGTLQSRLKAELRLSNVLDITSANDFLVEFISKFNNEFSITLDSTLSVFEKQLLPEEVNLHLSVLSQRIVDKGHSIKFEHLFYFPIDEKGKDLFLLPKTKVFIAKSLNGTFFCLTDTKVYNLRVIESHDKISKDFDLEDVIKSVKKRKIYSTAKSPLEKWKPY